MSDIAEILVLQRRAVVAISVNQQERVDRKCLKKWSM